MTGATGSNTVLPGVDAADPFIFVVKGGEIVHERAQKGIVLRDANNQCWQLSVDTLGRLTTKSIVCP
jgi:hypothetical protein